MHVLLDDDLGRLTLRRLWPWHRVMASSRAARLDRELAEGTSPETSAPLAARAIRLTSMEFRRDLAGSLRRILVAAGEPALPRGRALAARRIAHPTPVFLRDRKATPGSYQRERECCVKTFQAAVLSRAPGKAQTVIVVPSNLVMVKPSKSSPT